MSHHTAPSKPGHWQSEQLFDQADAYFDQLINSISRAKDSVDMEYYIFTNDPLGQRMIEALTAAARRGVSIRILLDGIGSSQFTDSAITRLQQTNIPVRIYHPLPWHIGHYARAIKQGSGLNKFFYFLRRINQRDHRKLVIIDNKDLWTGSYNISQQHLPRESGGESWRDYGVRVSGEGVNVITRNFDAIWDHNETQISLGQFRYFWNTLSERARRRRNHLLESTIGRAQDRIWIISAYFSPSHKVLRALKKASRKDLDIRIIVPRHSDVKIFPLLTASYYSDLLRSGIRVYEYSRSMLHAKALLIDDHFCLLGSTNFNHRSYLHDLELDIVLHSQQARDKLEDFFRQDLDASKEVHLEDLPKRYRLKLFGWLPRLLRYWM